jgi:hypothetical protein
MIITTRCGLNQFLAPQLLLSINFRNICINLDDFLKKTVFLQILNATSPSHEIQALTKLSVSRRNIVD